MPLDHAVEEALRSALAAQSTPDEIAEAICTALTEMIDQYVAGKLRPAELHGGDFAEATARALQFFVAGRYTALGRSLPRFDVLLGTIEASSLDDSLRIHIPRLLQVMYDIRNRRGVGHLPGPVSVNRSDAELLIQAAKWVAAEFIRLFHTTSHGEAEELIDSLARRSLPIVQDFEGTLRVITREAVSLPDEILLLLYAAEPAQPTATELVAWTRVSRSRVTTAVSRLDHRNLLHRFSDGRTRLAQPGQEEAERLLRALL
jgi:hypothetical protein